MRLCGTDKPEYTTLTLGRTRMDLPRHEALPFTDVLYISLACIKYVLHLNSCEQIYILKMRLTTF